MAKDKFYSKGLRFTCTGCGECCTWPGGHVLVSELEASAIAQYLNISEAEFLDLYAVFSTKDEIRLTEAPDATCVFFREGKCSIYPVRPFQCASFPFWPENLKSAYRWKSLSASCPGINRGRLHLSDEIESILRKKPLGE